MSLPNTDPVNPANTELQTDAIVNPISDGTTSPENSGQREIHREPTSTSSITPLVST